MKLTYSILWFDDNEDYLESLDKEYLEGEFKKWGFDCSINLVFEPENFISESPYKSYDLIVVDYSLDPYEKHGQEFIKLVRDQHVLTDVVFYSSHPSSELWDAIRKEEIEGVFISNRNNNQEKILKVAKQSIQKILDLENVRGIVMAEVGTNDDFLSKIAKSAFYKLNNEQKVKQINKYVNYEKERYSKSQITVEMLTNSTDIDALLELLDSTKKWEMCVSLSKIVKGLDIKGKGNYQEDVLDKRNFLAHGLPDKQADGALKFTHRGKNYTFDEAESLSLRKNLRKYSDFFESIVIELC